MTEAVAPKKPLKQRYSEGKQAFSEAVDTGKKRASKAVWYIGAATILTGIQLSTNLLSDAVESSTEFFGKAVTGHVSYDRVLEDVNTWVDGLSSGVDRLGIAADLNETLPSENNVQLLAGNNLEGAKAAARKANETLTGEFEVVRLVDSGVKYAVQGKSSNDCAEPILNGWSCTQKLSR